MAWTPYWADRWRLRMAQRALRGLTWYGVPQAFEAPEIGKRLPSVAEFLEWERRFRDAGAAGVPAYSWVLGGRKLLEEAWR